MNSSPTILFRNRHPLLSDVESALGKFFQDAPVWNESGYKSFPIDVKETNDSYVILAELPGVKKEEVDISLEKHVLTIQVNRTEEKESTEGKYVVKERSSSAMARSLSLAMANGESEVDARLTDGVLTITVKKSPEKKAKKVAIS